MAYGNCKYFAQLSLNLASLPSINLKPMSASVTYRAACPDDVTAIAQAVSLAGDGFLEFTLVNRPPNTTPLDLLIAETRKPEGVLSYKQADVAVVAGQVVGVVVSFAAEHNEAPPELEAMVPHDRLAALADFFAAGVPGSWYVDTLWVAAAQRRRGIGRALLNQAAARGQAAGRRVLSLMSWAVKTDAIAFYQAQGFEQVRTVPVGPHPAMPHPEGLVLLQRPIPA